MKHNVTMDAVQNMTSKEIQTLQKSFPNSHVPVTS